MIFALVDSFLLIGAPGALMAPKAKVGVSLEREILEEIDAIVTSSKHMDINRSQIIESILSAFLRSPFDHGEKVRELVVKRRREQL